MYVSMYVCMYACMYFCSFVKRFALKYHSTVHEQKPGDAQKEAIKDSELEIDLFIPRLAISPTFFQDLVSKDSTRMLEEVALARNTTNPEKLMKTRMAEEKTKLKEIKKNNVKVWKKNTPHFLG